MSVPSQISGAADSGGASSSSRLFGRVVDMGASNQGDVYGYDGSAYSVGDRVELHPGTDLWMRGARYGVVVGLSVTPKDRVRVRLDLLKHRTFTGTADTFRLVQS